MVREPSGELHPFLRGMVTHQLVQRGLTFDEAYAAARAVRARIEDREEVSTSELQDIVEVQLEEMLGSERLQGLAAASASESVLVVRHGAESPQPFSRGLLARSIHAAGPDLDRAYYLVTQLEDELRADGVTSPDRKEIALRVGDLLERLESRRTADQYRMVRSLRHLPRPVVIYLGGASGTGKSTLALSLAPLLRIYRITATDTVRQVMRMVFSPAILPAIHRSSFEGYVAGELPLREEPGASELDSDPQQRLLAGFEEQATRICVGVRAVVERNLEEHMSLVLEGVHLVPPLVPFVDLGVPAYQAVLLLSTLDEETHRTRFLERAWSGGRRAERYLESFQEIRSIQGYLLQKADQHDVPIVETTEGEGALASSLSTLTGVLQQRHPQIMRPQRPLRERAPVLLLAFDGLADRPLRALGGRTPLQAADTPNLDRLAREGRTGVSDPVAPEVVPDTASGTLALLGQSPKAMNRGAVEAIGCGMVLSTGDVALRGNLATLDEAGQVVDRRSGRIREGTEELVEALDQFTVPGEGVEVRVGRSTEHRLAIVLRGRDLSARIQGSDPGDAAPLEQPLTPRAIDPENEAAVRTARALALFEQEARRVLSRHPVSLRRRAAGLPQPNAVLTRGAGRVHRLVPPEHDGLPLSTVCVAGDRTILGLASWIGARLVTNPRMTANLDSAVEEKFDAAAEALTGADLVILHLKGADIAAHDQRSDLKVSFIESVDRQLGRLLDGFAGPLRIGVASDHATLSETGQHGVDPVPVLVWGEGVEADDVQRFDEQAVVAGSLGRFPLQMLLHRLFEEG